jgi:hypothetical protein
MIARIVAAAVAGLLVGIAGTAAVLLTNRSPGVAVGTAASTAASSSNPLAPGVPGWGPVQSDRGLAFDIPPTWQPPDGDFRLAILDANQNPLAGMRYTAVYRTGQCAADTAHLAAAAGIGSGTGTDPASAAAVGATNWAHSLYTPDNATRPDVTLSKPADVTVGSVQGKLITAKVKLTAKSQCGEQSAIVYVVAVPAKDTGMALLVAFADQDVPKAESDENLRKIASSLRPL